MLDTSSSAAPAGAPQAPSKIGAVLRSTGAPINLVVRAAFNPNLKTSWFSAMTQVINQITIKAVAKSSDVTGKIEEAFRRSANLEARRIKVSTKDGKVTLSGSVSTWSERDDAVWAAWSAPGVSAVKDDLMIAH